jgi:hypothetical protein
MSDKRAIDLAAAREKLKGLPARRLDGDWLAVDTAGHVAFFAGNEHGPVPVTADRERVGEALEAIARAGSVRHAAATAQDAYRGIVELAQDPIFDAPCSSRGRPLHERPLEGFPLLVVGAHPALREVAAEWGARDAMTREGFGVVFPVIGLTSYDELHEKDICGGCRVLDDPADARPRAPEALAAAGLYVYAHVDEDRREPYRRIAGPTVPADLVDLEPLAQLVASLVPLPITFESAGSLVPDDLVTCAI